MEHASNPLIRFLYLPCVGYTMYPYEEVTPGVTHLELGFSLQPINGKQMPVFRETLLVSANIPEYAIDFLLSKWTSRIAAENHIDLSILPVESDWFTFGNSAGNRDHATDRHADLVQQAISDAENGATPPPCVFIDRDGFPIRPGDTLMHNQYGVTYKVVDHLYSLALSVPQDGKPDLVIPFEQLAEMDGSNELADWINTNNPF